MKDRLYQWWRWLFKIDWEDISISPEDWAAQRVRWRNTRTGEVRFTYYGDAA